MRSPLDNRTRMIKFASLTLGLLMAASTVVCLAFHSIPLTIASAIIGGWALTVFVDTLRDEWLTAMRGRDDEREA